MYVWGREREREREIQQKVEKNVKKGFYVLNDETTEKDVKMFIFL